MCGQTTRGKSDRSSRSSAAGLVSTLLLSIPLIMATHIVSWGDSKHITSPVNSSKPSIVSIDSIQTSLLSKHMSSVLTEPSGSGTLTPASAYPRADAADTSFERHQKYFFKDGNVTFLVSGVRP